MAEPLHQRKLNIVYNPIPPHLQLLTSGTICELPLSLPLLNHVITVIDNKVQPVFDYATVNNGFTCICNISFQSVQLITDTTPLHTTKKLAKAHAGLLMLYKLYIFGYVDDTIKPIKLQHKLYTSIPLLIDTLPTSNDNTINQSSLNNLDSYGQYEQLHNLLAFPAATTNELLMLRKQLSLSISSTDDCMVTECKIKSPAELQQPWLIDDNTGDVTIYMYVINTTDLRSKQSIGLMFSTPFDIDPIELYLNHNRNATIMNCDGPYKIILTKQQYNDAKHYHANILYWLSQRESVNRFSNIEFDDAQVRDRHYIVVAIKPGVIHTSSTNRSQQFDTTSLPDPYFSILSDAVRRSQQPQDNERSPTVQTRQLDIAKLSIHPKPTNHYIGEYHHVHKQPLNVSDKHSALIIDWAFMSTYYQSRCSLYDFIRDEQNDFVYDKINYSDVILQTTHINRIYRAIKARHDVSITSSFNRHTRQTFLSYFKAKHNIDLQHIDHPLVEAAPLKLRAQNMLQPSNHQSKKGDICIPYELCNVLVITSEYVKLLLCVPSLLWRIESQLLLHELQYKINLPVELSLLRTATYTANAHEYYNLERLEFLGDCVLKFVISEYLYCMFHSYEEEQLTSIKAILICNNTLAQLSKIRNLHHYVHASAFRPAYFAASGLPLQRGKKMNAEDGDDINSNDNTVHNEYVDIYRQSISDKMYADVVESLIGAYYLSLNITNAKQLIHWVGLPVYLPGDTQLTTDILPASIQVLNNSALRSDVKHTLFASMQPTYISPIHSYNYTLPDQPSILLSQFISHSKPAIEQLIDYKFSSPMLLVQAFSHSSYINGTAHNTGDISDYQRLEFLGDAVLDLLITEYITRKYEYKSSGSLTLMRQTLVSGIAFAHIVIQHKLYQYILHDFQSNTVELQVQQYWSTVHTNQLTIHQTVQRMTQPPKLISDIFESLIGAVFIDSSHSLMTTWNVLMKLAKFQNVDPSILKNGEKMSVYAPVPIQPIELVANIETV